jgi:hypothetical protein
VSNFNFALAALHTLFVTVKISQVIFVVSVRCINVSIASNDDSIELTSTKTFKYQPIDLLLALTRICSRGRRLLPISFELVATA